MRKRAMRGARQRERLITYYQGWCAWAHEVLAPSRSATIGQFASILLDGILMQMVSAAPDFGLKAALVNARATLRHLLILDAGESAPRSPETTPLRRARPHARRGLWARVPVAG